MWSVSSISYLLLPLVITVCLAKPPPDWRCKLPVVSGYSDELIKSYYFDEATMTCKSFIYRGRGGNANRFSMMEHCLAACAGNDYDELGTGEGVLHERRPTKRAFTAVDEDDADRQEQQEQADVSSMTQSQQFLSEPQFSAQQLPELVASENVNSEVTSGEIPSETAPNERRRMLRRNLRVD